MARKEPLGPVPLDPKQLPRWMGCSYQTWVRETGRIASMPAWALQAYGIFIFIKFRQHSRAKCGISQFHLVGRKSFHRITGDPGRKIRTRLRLKSPRAWIDQMVRRKILLWSMLKRGMKAANDKHKGFTCSERQEDGREARPPPPEERQNRAGLRRFNKIAREIQLAYNADAAAPRLNLHTWLCSRLEENHPFASILGALRHAVKVLKRKGAQDIPWTPAKPEAWIQAVALRHLECDGFTSETRLWWHDYLNPMPRRKRQGAPAPTFKEKNEGEGKNIFVDPDGRSWEYVSGTYWKPI